MPVGISYLFDPPASSRSFFALDRPVVVSLWDMLLADPVLEPAGDAPASSRSFFALDRPVVVSLFIPLFVS
jgi:hypothetical protein